ncbi:MAG: STAS domain-containing protein [Pyrinomonadaceae bacterium]
MNTIVASAVSADSKTAIVFAGDYLNKLTGEQVERECRLRLNEGCTELIVNFSRTEMVNSIGVSILLGVIDSAANASAKIVFSDVNEATVELFDMLGVSKHAVVNPQF